MLISIYKRLIEKKVYFELRKEDSTKISSWSNNLC